jgi:NADP-dependent aldehyde dehydrogenase
MPVHPILIAGRWQSADFPRTFRASNPATDEVIAEDYPISGWADVDAALTAAAAVPTQPPDKISAFLTRYAERIEARAAELVEQAHLETGLPKAPRLSAIEIPRTTGQLRQASAAALEGSWALPTIDRKLNIRSAHAAIGPVCVFGPNNFPYAFNAISGGDFAAAIAAGNPVIAKAHPLHPGTTRLLAEEAHAALNDTGLPAALVQLLYHISPEDGLRLVADPRTGASAFTGSRGAGLKLKAAADAAGKPIYLEMSSLNPVFILPGALRERPEKIADELADSCLAGSGQFCTKPGLIFVMGGDAGEALIEAVQTRFKARPVAPLLSSDVAKGLSTNVKRLISAGAQLMAGGSAILGEGSRFANTLLRVHADHFMAHAEPLQTEAFGNSTLFVVIRNAAQMRSMIDLLEGNLTGCIYSDSQGSDDSLYAELAPALRQKVGRLLNDKMPTGVAVSPAMNHGGPYPASGHPGFTSVGIPASMRRFSCLQCYDNFRPARLPALLADKNPTGRTWRLIDGQWSQADLTT